MLIQEELIEFKSKAEEFERKYSEVQKQTETLIKETEESQSKLSQLQEMIERYVCQKKKKDLQAKIIHIS